MRRLSRSLVAVTLLAIGTRIESQAQPKSQDPGPLRTWPAGFPGHRLGLTSGKDKHNPSRDAYRTKNDVVKLLGRAVAEGAAVIKQQGDAGLDRTTPFGWEQGRHVAHNSYIWMSGIEHSSEHFGQLVVYYRANHLIPPESRR